MSKKFKLYDTWERYYNPKHPKHKYQRARHHWILKRIKGKKLLDVGCAGGLALYLAGTIDEIKELHGIDINSISIKQAERRLIKYSDKKIVLNVGYAENINRENEYFDCIICGETLEHLPDDTIAVKEMYRVMKKNGILIISVPDRGHISKQHLRLYTNSSLKKLVENAGFKVIEEDTMKSAHKKYYYLLLVAIKNKKRKKIQMTTTVLPNE